jgi:hypothetical protein
MGTKFFYAVVLTVCTIVLQLLLFFLGYQTEKLATGQTLQWFGVVILALVLWFGIKAVREEKPGKTLTYGQGVGAGVLISLYGGLMTAVYTIIHLKFINTNYAEYTMDMIRAKWAAAGMTQAQMARAEGFTRGIISPWVQVPMGVFFTVLFGLVISAIFAAFLKRDKPVIAPATSPPAPPPIG